jgi:hypothetical protein
MILSFLLIFPLASCQGLFNPDSIGYGSVQTPEPVVVYDSKSSPVSLPPVFTATATKPGSPVTPYVPQDTPTPTLTPPIIGFGQFPDDINPLTGLKVENLFLLNRRPIIVKVSNYPRFGRPHAGLSTADIVFDYYIGYGQNRFAAIYYQNDEPMVGPMRSGRLVDGQLGRLYQAVVFYRNVDPDVNEGIQEKLGDLAIWNAECPPLCNVGEYSVASTFGNTEEMETYIRKKGLDNKKPDLSGMIFDPRKPQEGDVIEKIGIQFGVEDRAEWVYNTEAGAYQRWIESSASLPLTMIPLVDRNTGQQIAVQNLIVLFAEYETFSPSLHDIHLWDNFNGEKAYFFRNGLMMDGSWRAVNKDRPIQFNDRWGRNYSLEPGNTWIVIMDIHSAVVFGDHNSVDFKFRLGENNES